MTNLYLTATSDPTGYRLNIDTIARHVPATDHTVITIPQTKIKDLIEHLTTDLNEHPNQTQTHLGIRYIDHSIELNGYVRTNPEFNDYHLKNIDNLSPRTTDQPQVDDFIVIDRNSANELNQRLKKLS